MKTRWDVLQAIKNGKESECIDRRDFHRLASFFPEEDLTTFGFELIKGSKWKTKELTYENVVAQLKTDVEFGFEKALDKRGISSELMYEVVKMWMWVLNDDLADLKDYAMYGLPLYKAVALKYGFENLIGKDEGNEPKYGED